MTLDLPKLGSIKILDRYILNRFIFTLFFSLISFVLLVIFVDIVGNLSRFLDKNVPGPIVAKFYLAYIPYLAMLVLPISMLLASLFSIGQMARHNELIAIKATGISLVRILQPVWIFGILISCLALIFNEKVVPQANQAKSAIENEYLDPFKNNTPARIDDIFLRDKVNRKVFIRVFDTRNNVAERVAIQSYSGNQIVERWDAERMVWQDSTWILQEGFKRKLGKDSEEALPFDELVDPHLDILPQNMAENQAEPQDMSYFELQEFIKDIIRNGGDPKRWLVDLHFKLSTPFVSFILILFGAPLASNKKRSGAIFGLITSVGIYLLYFGMARLLQTLGHVGTLPPFLSAWLTNIFFLMAAILLLYWMRK